MTLGASDGNVPGHSREKYPDGVGPSRLLTRLSRDRFVTKQPALPLCSMPKSLWFCFLMGSVGALAYAEYLPKGAPFILRVLLRSTGISRFKHRSKKSSCHLK